MLAAARRGRWTSRRGTRNWKKKRDTKRSGTTAFSPVPSAPLDTFSLCPHLPPALLTPLPPPSRFVFCGLTTEISASDLEELKIAYADRPTCRRRETLQSSSGGGKWTKWRKNMGKGWADQMVKFCCFTPSVSREEEGNGGSWKRKSGIHSPVTPKNVKLFSYNSLRSATGNFHPSNKLGRGGFGIVYKGILRDGTPIAVKSLSAESKQGDTEFLTEIGMVSNVRHPNLVHLLGCCVEDNNRMLVYEYLENNSLASALLGPRRKQIVMDWPKRAAVCIGTAHGLAFLHEEAKPHIVHRDIKASNVLLDKELIPKIGDFGLAKLFPDNVTHISTRVAGTMGYLAPEYALLGQLTKKADIYSFGVLILEIVSGRSSMSAWGNDLKILLEWTWCLREQGRLLDVVDPELVGYPEKDVLRFIKVALVCTQATAQKRPSMKQVVDMLSEDMDIDVSELIHPGIIKEADDYPVKYYGDTAGSVQANKGSICGFTTSLRNSLLTSPFSTVEVVPR